MIRVLVVAAVAVTLSVSGALGLNRNGSEEDRPTGAPVGAAEVLGAADGVTLEATVAALQARLDRLPGDAGGWATLALAYVEQARVTGDATLYDRAAAAVDRSIQEQPEENAAAYAASAALSAARHDFTEALDHADRALAIDPFLAGALAVRVDALTELGRYAEQLSAVRIADRRQPGIPAATRYSYAFELRGQLARASSVLRAAGGSAAAAEQAFTLTLLADLERRQGQLDRAATHLRQALRRSPDHVPALAGQAHLAVARGDLPAAVSRWQQVVLRLPLPEYLTALGELHLAMGRPKAAQAQFDVVATTNRLLARNGVNTDLESALFEADHGSPATALAAARAEWERRRSIHVADVLAWSLHRTGQDRAALRYSRLSTRLGTAEPLLWLHRGTIEAALGMTVPARTHLRRGLATDPGQSPWQAAQARKLLHELGRQR